MGQSWSDHVIDFFVIFFADVAAAYFALIWFESRKEDRDQARRSLNQLIFFGSTFHQRYQQMFDNYKEASESTGTGLPTDNSEDGAKFASIASDAQFWSFKGSESIRPLYEKVLNDKDSLRVRTVGEARLKLNALMEHISNLNLECAKRLQKKTFL